MFWGKNGTIEMVYRIKGKELVKGQILFIEGASYTTYPWYSNFKYQGKLIGLDKNKKTITLDCSGEYNASVKEVKIRDIESIEIIKDTD